MAADHAFPIGPQHRKGGGGGGGGTPP
eukprot:COSAG01_NODE_1894_length_8959_cov_3.852603_16_plen_26_part_01